MTSIRKAPALLLCALAALAIAPSAPRAQPAPPRAPSAIGRRIVVLSFDALGMDADKVARLEALFRIELERLAGAASPSPREIARALRGTQLASCSGESRCLAAIGKRLTVELVVTGNVAALGDSYVVNIKVVNVASGQELRRIASDPLRGNPDELIDAVRVAAYRLLAPEHLLGAISILADIDGATVRVDGKQVGRTPLVRPLADLPLGPHRLEVAAPGFSTFAQDVLVRFQKTTRVEVRLLAEAARPGVDLGGRPAAPARAPAQPAWYQRPWFLVGAGVAAVLVGGTIGYALSHADVIDCASSPEECR